ncbi:hypothetical protein GGR56DRAFT_662194 [Xylariaceae sp. FL0804]|nr:hypothetical protein GGR56DRAFT_662194 [Xylariaceae sp. FL0804]
MIQYIRKAASHPFLSLRSPLSSARRFLRFRACALPVRSQNVEVAQRGSGTTWKWHNIIRFFPPKYLSNSTGKACEVAVVSISGHHHPFRLKSRTTHPATRLLDRRQSPCTGRHRRRHRRASTARSPRAGRPPRQRSRTAATPNIWAACRPRPQCRQQSRPFDRPALLLSSFCPRPCPCPLSSPAAALTPHPSPALLLPPLRPL